MNKLARFMEHFWLAVAIGTGLVAIWMTAMEPGREALVVGQERHDLGRPDDVGYPSRGLFLEGFLYVQNFEPARWPMGDPITGYLNTDGGPPKTELLAQNRQGINHALWVLNFGRKPAEELYELARDPDCVRNLAADPAFADRREAMRARLFAELRRQRDPRDRDERREVHDPRPFTRASSGRAC